MRTPIVRESYLKHPLSLMLATPGSVRVLRELLASEGAASVPMLAKQTKLNPQTVRNALVDLTAGGVVEALGHGRSQLYRADVSHPLYLALASLFQAEAERYQTIMASIANAADHITPTPLAAWAYGACARGEDTASNDLDVCVVAADEQAEAVGLRMRELIEPVQAVQRVWVSVVVLAPSTVRTMAARRDSWWVGATEPCIPLFGEKPVDLAARLARPDRPGPPFRA